jgi:hypothetical protein
MAKEFTELIAGNRNVIAKKWFDLTIQTYHPDTAKFIKGKSDAFANPVGSVTSNGLKVLLDQLLGEFNHETLTSSLDPIIRIRAVQDFSPSQAIAFIPGLKSIIRESLSGEAENPQHFKGLSDIDARIDQLFLIAVDIYVQCREKIFEISANEVRNRTFRAFKRAGLIKEESSERVVKKNG